MHNRTQEQTWRIGAGLNLALTLRMCLPVTRSLLRVESDVATYSLRTADGAATIRLELAEDLLIGEASGPGAAAALAAVPRTVGLDDDADAFSPGPGLLSELARKQRGFRLGSTGRAFDTILPTVLGQRVTTAEAATTYERLVRKVGEPAPGGELLLPPLPEAVLGLSFTDLHELGIEQARARVVKEVSARAARIEEIATMDRANAERRLLAIRGVGPWTSAQVMGSAWGDRDAIPIGDFHLPNTVAWALAGEPRADDDRMLELLEPYRPQRRRALLLIKTSGIHAPKYGPKTSQSIISRGRNY